MAWISFWDHREKSKVQEIYIEGDTFEDATGLFKELFAVDPESDCMCCGNPICDIGLADKLEDVIMEYHHEDRPSIYKTWRDSLKREEVLVISNTAHDRVMAKLKWQNT